MAKSIDDKVAYYYDSHPTEEDLMGEKSLHAALVRYLMAVLQWLFEGERCALYDNLNFYQTPNAREYPLAPDIAVIKGVDYIEDIPHWRVGKMGPPPHVLFEIASDETWKKDLHEKPQRYAQMGVQEYFAYDPHPAPVYRSVGGQRLLGWHLVHGVLQEMTPGPGGYLWSTQLDSFLLPDGKRLRLTDRNGSLRLTEAQAQARRANAEAEARKAEARRADTEARRANAEARRANAEARRAEALAEKLRSLGIDPDHL